MALAIDTSVKGTTTSTIATSVTSAALTTAGTNELLIAFIGGDGATGVGSGDVSSVTGGPGGWTKILTANSQLISAGNNWNGWCSVWRAFASAQVSAQTIAANFSAAGAGWIVVVAFTGADTTGTNGSGAIGANDRTGAASGAPSKAVTTTRNNSWVWGTIWDWSNNVTPTIPGTQTQRDIFNDSTNGDSGWVQYQTALTATSGTSVTLNDTAPTADNFNLVIIEILPAVAAGGVQSTQTTPYIGLWSKDGVLYTGAFDAGIPIQFGLFDDGYVAQFSGTTVGATASGVHSVAAGLFDRDTTLIGMYGAN